MATSTRSSKRPPKSSRPPIDDGRGFAMRLDSEGCGDVAVTSATETIAFGPVTVTYDAGVLRPRPWTLAQAQWAAALLEGAPAGHVLELGCGAGHIGLAIAAWS